VTAIAGIWSFASSEGLTAAVEAMIAAQRAYGINAPAYATLDSAAFAHCLYPVLPEDELGTEPLIDPSGRWMLVADVRLDNRDELLDRLSLRAGTGLSDSRLLFQAFLTWGEACLDHILGDFCFGIWDARDQSLLLVRDPTGQRPLHYHLADSFVAFASMPQGLHALAAVPQELELDYLAAFVSDERNSNSKTCFQHVFRVEPGQSLKITPGGTSRRRYWQMPSREIRYSKQSDYVEAFREQLDRATRARLRGAESLVGAHLSAGLDSSAVAATAARLRAQGGGKVVAFTSAPRAEFRGPSFPGRLADESGPAAEVAAWYPNMEHVVVRTGAASPLDILGCDAELFQQPVGHPCNFVWWSAVHDQAQVRGISVMLTGEAGNLTMSAGGLGMLTEYVRAGRLLKWQAEARSLAGDVASWRGVLATSFGPWAPPKLWRFLNKRFAKGSTGELPLLVHSTFRARLKAGHIHQSSDNSSEKSHRRALWNLLQDHEPANFRKGILAKWGVDERDPTADRRLAEFCFALPPDQFLSGGVTRRLARRSLADRLPTSVLKGIRGYQYADWYERIDGASLTRALADLERGPAAASFLDFKELRELASSWPVESFNSGPNIAKYRLRFLMALSAGAFANKLSIRGSDGE
jgi:asparagine synthase (glutamine-hydrolysing)